MGVWFYLINGIPVSLESSKFECGLIVQTAGIRAACKENFKFAEYIARSLKRHSEGDWGDVCDEDWETNQKALMYGGRLFSAYQDTSASGLDKIWIITEADRSATTILFPDEY